MNQSVKTSFKYTDIVIKYIDNNKLIRDNIIFDINNVQIYFILMLVIIPYFPTAPIYMYMKTIKINMRKY